MEKVIGIRKGGGGDKSFHPFKGRRDKFYPEEGIKFLTHNFPILPHLN